mgnify:CR=1 FL=1
MINPLEQIRKKLGWSKTKMALRLRMPLPTYICLESGRRLAGVESILKIEKFLKAHKSLGLGVTLQDFLKMGRE